MTRRLGHCANVLSGYNSAGSYPRHRGGVCPVSSDRGIIHASTRTPGAPAAHRQPDDPYRPHRRVSAITGSPCRPGAAARRLRVRWDSTAAGWRTAPVVDRDPDASVDARSTQPIVDGVMLDRARGVVRGTRDGELGEVNNTLSGHVILDVAPRSSTRRPLGQAPDSSRATTAPPSPTRSSGSRITRSPGSRRGHREIVGRPTTGVTLITCGGTSTTLRGEYLYRTVIRRSGRCRKHARASADTPAADQGSGAWRSAAAALPTRVNLRAEATTESDVVRCSRRGRW